MNKTKSKYFSFLKFNVETFFLQTISPENNKKLNIKSLTVDPDIEIFTNHDEKKDKLIFIVKFKITVNKQKKPGYYIIANFLGFFELKKIKELNENLIKQYILFTAIPIMISSARIELSHLTQHAIFGEYFLPAIDLQSLLDKLAKKA